MDDVGEPTLLQALRAHRGEVTCVDSSGAWLVSGGGDRALRLWRWAAGAGWQEAAAAPGAHRYGVTAARWASAGAAIASAGVDGAVRVWCGRTLAARRVLAAPGAVAARALCWPAGARLLAGHDDGVLCVWCAERGVLLARLSAHEGALHAVCAPACGALLLTACTHGVLKVFDLAEVCESGGSECAAAPAPLLWVDGAHDLGALCADASEDGGAAATGGHDGVVRVWRVECAGGVRGVRGARGARGPRAVCAGPALEGHAAAVTALRWATRTPRALLASASLDRTARLWEPAAAACLRVISAHARYLTCVVLAPDLRYLITGSNDKSVRTWSLGQFSLSEELEPACEALAHFALGDLEGIGPVELEEPAEEDGAGEDSAEGQAVPAGGAPHAHAGAVNCVSAHEDLLATASSDGWVKIFRWRAAAGEAGGEAGALEELHALGARGYPALAVEFGAGGRVLLGAGLDGAARLWDVQTGVQLRSLCVPTAGAARAARGEGGGGGVRGARVSPLRPPRALLVTDDGLAPLWSLTGAVTAAPDHVYVGHSEAATCCAWSPDARVLATGAASGELRLHAPPPVAATLHHESVAHDLGVQSCDFAPSCSAQVLPERTYLLATAGSDSFIKLWMIELAEAGDGASVRAVRQWEAHGGGVTSVRWGAGAAGAALASAGVDRWARVWRVWDAGARVAPHAAVHVPDGALAVALLCAAPGLVLAAGTLGGALALWRVPAVEPPDAELDEGAAPRWWGARGVARWLREYVTRAPGSPVAPAEELRLMQRARDLRVTGATLLDEPLDTLLADLGYGEECEECEECAGSAACGACGACGGSGARAQLRSELQWLRRTPPPPHTVADAPHALRCPLTHGVLREPARAADGFTYERAAALEWFLAAGGAVSPVSGRRMRNARLLPNYALRNQLRAYLLQLDAPPHAP